MNSKLRSLLASAGIAAAIALSAAQTAAAETPAKAPDEEKSCFFVNQISGWNRIDDKTVRVTVSSKRQYDLTLMSPTFSGLHQEVIGIKADPSNYVCTGNGLGVSVITGEVAGPSSYPVTKVTLVPPVRKASAGKPAPASTPAPEAPTPN